MEHIVLISVHNNIISHEYVDTLKAARALMKLEMIDAGVNEDFFTPSTLCKDSEDKKIGFDFFNAHFDKSETDKYAWKILSI